MGSPCVVGSCSAPPSDHRETGETQTEEERGDWFGDREGDDPSLLLPERVRSNDSDSQAIIRDHAGFYQPPACQSEAEVGDKHGPEAAFRSRRPRRTLPVLYR